MRAIMYHYVRERDPRLPFFRYLDFANFRRQLDYFESEFGFVDRQEFDLFLDGGIPPRRPGKVLLTFDDGFVDHYDNVLPELLRRGLWGIFYIPARPHLSGEILDVHRVQMLCGSVQGADLYAAALSVVSEEMMPDSKIAAFRNETYANQKDARGVTEVKRILNYFIDYSHREVVIDQLCQRFGVDCSTAHLYLGKDQMAEMEREGMIIGSHTVNHPVMSKLDRKRQEQEIASSFDFLGSFLRMKRKTYCHPHGGFNSFNEDTVTILNELGVDFSVNVESRQIVPGDRLSARQYFPRFDCNEFPFGQAS